ncbi:MAG: nickel pincer cofactor biosynthesis protein LarB, partial [Smithellaceae bacterium]|nr:nickel pincer cofactor biosynthesis protein LarB [Smithellaceae bacterium]
MNYTTLDELLTAYKQGKIDLKEVQELVVRLFYEEGEFFLLDLHREKRIGFPEVVYAEGKDVDHLLAIVEKVLEKKDIVFVSRITSEKEEALRQHFPSLQFVKKGRLLVIKKGTAKPKYIGAAGIITAGTSDIPFAEECGLILEELGVKVSSSYDSGASGMHRPHLSLKQVKDSQVLIIFAGMEGVLPTLIASLSDLPVIAVPTPVGYGYGGEGIGALTTMLQTCVPGVLVVNIGNTIGAAAAA